MECFDPPPAAMVQKGGHKHSSSSGKTYEQYSVNIASPPVAGRPSMPPMAQNMMSPQGRKKRAAMEANRAAWGYTKVALLFFVSLLVTWVSSHKISLSINASLTLQNPGAVLRQSRLRFSTSWQCQCRSGLRSRSCPLAHGLLELGHIHSDLKSCMQGDDHHHLLAKRKSSS